MDKILYLAITNHGFGHATRAAAIAGTIQSLDPEITIIIATTAPRSVLEFYIPGPFIHRPRSFDIGVVQADSITMDLPETLKQLEAIRAKAPSLIASEANYLKQNRVGLVMADIPPLAAPIAKAAGVPAWLMGNFGWDFIYRDFADRVPEFAAIADWMGECFSLSDRLFRMPFCEPMSAFPNITDVGLTGANPRTQPEEVIAAFNLGEVPQEKRILMTFGGLGLDRIPYELVERFPDHRFICFDLKAPDYPNLLRVDDQYYRPIDFMPICGRIISKPGYSTFSEACRFDLPITSLIREGFAEAPIMLEGLQNHMPHQIITPEEFFQGDWDFLHQPMNPPKTDVKLGKDGNQAIAQAVVDFFKCIASVRS
jgi:hypothetical protein